MMTRRTFFNEKILHEKSQKDILQKIIIIADLEDERNNNNKNDY